MYAESIVTSRLELAKNELGWNPERHTVEEIDDFNSRLYSKYEDYFVAARSAGQGGQDPHQAEQIYLQRILGDPSNPRLTREESRFIQNEQYLSMCDAAYFLTRYFWIKNRENILQRFTFQAGQMCYFNVVSYLEAKGAAIEIILAKARQLGMCLHPNTRVLTADLKWFKISEIKVGDRLVGCDESAVGSMCGRRMKETIVEATRTVVSDSIAIELENGESVIATPQHRWLSMKRGGVETCWRKTEDFRVGDKIRYITKPWCEPDYEDGWFSGLLDGEGSLRGKDRAGAELCVAQVPGPVLDRARRYLTDRGYTIREDVDNRKKGTGSKLGDKPVVKLVLGRADEIFRMIGQLRPSRLLTKQWWQGKSLPGRKSGIGWAKVVAIGKLDSPRTMIDLQTSSKTFIANGFVSHNSTITAGLLLHKVAFTYGIDAIMASADREKTGDMAQKIFMAYDYLPWWMRPGYTRRVESNQGMLVFGSQRSGIKFQHGAQTSGIARGSTIVGYHLSEVASYANAGEIVEASLFKAVHPSPKVFGILESTCKGNVGWWYETYRIAKNEWKNGRSRLMALFLPFWVATDMYPNETERRVRPVPANWRPEPETRAMIAKSKMYLKSNPVLEEVLGANWEMSRDQAWYWEYNHFEHRAKGMEKKWFEEMPCDDDEAFQGSYDSVFGREVIATAYTNRKVEYNVYGIVGQSIEDKHEPPQDEVDYEQERVPITYSDRKGRNYRWELVPLEWEEPQTSLDQITDLVDSYDGKLFVWEPPRPDYDYSIGVDTSNGIGDDFTVIAVARRARGQADPDVQVAEFRSRLVSHVEAWPFALAIAAYYARFMPNVATIHSEPYVSVEQVMAVGDTCQLQMSKCGYHRFHRFHRYDSMPKDMKASKSHKRGWFTHSWSRPMLLDGFVIAVQNGWYIVHSPVTIWEMDHFEVHYTKTGKERKEHADEFNDDGIFANAMATFCPNDMESLAKRTNKRLDAGDVTTLPPVDIRPWSGHTMNTLDY